MRRDVDDSGDPSAFALSSTNTTTTRIPDSPGSHKAAITHRKQFSFVQILGPKSTNVHKIRKVVRVNAAKASAEARKKTMAQRQRQHAHTLPQPTRSMSIIVSSPQPSPPQNNQTLTPQLPHPAATNCLAQPGPLESSASAHGTSAWKVNIANLLNRCTPPPTPEHARSPSSTTSR